MGELEIDRRMTRTEVATVLRELADGRDAEGALALDVAGRRVRFDPVEPITVTLEGESDRPAGATEAKQSIEVELVWWRPAGEGGPDLAPGEEGPAGR